MAKISQIKPTQVNISGKEIPSSPANPSTDASIWASDGADDGKWKPDPTPEVSALQSGDALVVDTIDTTQKTATYKAEPFIPADDGTLSLVNQSGIIGDLAITYSNLVITIPSYKAVFYNSATNARIIIDKSQETLTIAAAGQNTDDVTWVEILSDGSYSQTTSRPSDIDTLTRNFIAEVDHPEGGNIVGVKPIYKPYDVIQTRMRALGNALGISSSGFRFSYEASTGAVSQTSNVARVFGYGIGEFGYKEFLTSSVQGRYLSFDSTESGMFTTLLKTYKIDDPANNTSSDIGNGKFAMLLLFASVTGEYAILAPQEEFDDTDAALANVLLYPSQVTRPKELDEFFKLVASIVVPKTVGTNNNDVMIYATPEVGFGGASANVNTGSTVPDPSTGNVGDRLVVNAAGNALEYQPEPTVDTTGSTAMSVLQREASGDLKTADMALNKNLAFYGNDVRYGTFDYDFDSNQASNFTLDFVTDLDSVSKTNDRTAGVAFTLRAKTGLKEIDIIVATMTINPVEYTDTTNKYTAVASTVSSTISQGGNIINFIANNQNGKQTIWCTYRFF